MSDDVEKTLPCGCRVKTYRDFLGRVDQVRRQAAAATLLDDRNQARLRLEEEDARHDAEIRSVNEAQVKGLLTEEAASRKRAALATASTDSLPAQHVDGRRRLLRERLDLEARVTHVDHEVEAIELPVGAAAVRPGGIAAVFPQGGDVIPRARRVVA